MSENIGKKTRLVPAVCTQCGGQLEVDPNQQAAVCPYCGTPFIVEKAINQYNITHIHQHNTVHVQNGKKGIFQSVADLADRQLEREQNARIRAAELELEQQRLDMIREEKRKASRNSFWKKVLWFFGWIYCFPIPVTILVSRKKDLDQNRKRIFIGIAWAAYALILLFGGSGSSSSSSGSETAASRRTPAPAVQQKTPAPAVQKKTPVPETKTVWKEKNVQANDFDTMEHTTLTIGDYMFEIPAWQAGDNGSYQIKDSAGTVWGLFGASKGSSGGMTEDLLAKSHTEMITGYMTSERFRDSVLMEEDSFTVNGITMYSGLFHADVGDQGNSLPALNRVIWFLNPSDGSLITLQIVEADAWQNGYRDDLMKIANTVRLAGVQTAAGNGMSFEEFKQKMDSYEQFFNMYVDFMKTYDTNDTSALMQYMNLMTQYYEAMEALDSIDESQLTPEQDAYYLQVMLRIEQKLLEAVNY